LFTPLENQNDAPGRRDPQFENHGCKWVLYALLKKIVNFSQSINQSQNISPNDQHLFANTVKSTTAKFAHTT